MLTLRKIENVPTGPNNRPKLAVKITGTIMVSASEVVVYGFFLQNVGRCRSWRDLVVQFAVIIGVVAWKLRSRKNQVSEFRVVYVTYGTGSGS
jgi:hypothetical protein